MTPSSNSDPSQVTFWELVEPETAQDNRHATVHDRIHLSLDFLLILFFNSIVASPPIASHQNGSGVLASQALVLLQSLEKKLESQTEVPWGVSLRLNVYAKKTSKHCNCLFVDLSFLGNRLAEKSLQVVIICRRCLE